jgi:hypothetical protein
MLERLTVRTLFAPLNEIRGYHAVRSEVKDVARTSVRPHEQVGAQRGELIYVE